MRPLAFLVSLTWISVSTGWTVGQPPPLPENYKPVSILATKKQYKPPPETLTPENYKRYRDETLAYLTFRPWAENSPAIRLDLLKTAMAMGNDQDEEQFRLDLIVYHPDSPEGNFLLQNSAISELYDRLVRRILNDDSKTNIDDFYAILKPLRYFKDKNEQTNKSNKYTQIKEIEEGLELMKAIKENSTSTSLINTSKNQLEESAIEKLYLSNQIKGTLEAEKLNIKKDELKKIIESKSSSQADIFIYFYHIQRDNLLNRCFSKFIYENILDEQTKNRKSVSIIATKAYLKEKKFTKAEAVLENLISNKQECPQALFLLALTKFLLGKSNESTRILLSLQKPDKPDEQKLACKILLDIIKNNKEYTSISFTLIDKYLEKIKIEQPKNLSLKIDCISGKKTISTKIFIDFFNNSYKINASFPDGQTKELIYINNFYYFNEDPSKKSYKVKVDKHTYLFHIGPDSLENQNNMLFTWGINGTEHLNLIKILQNQFANNFLLSQDKRSIYLNNCKKNLVFFKHAENKNEYAITRYDFSDLTFDISMSEILIDKNYDFKQIDCDKKLTIKPVRFEPIVEPKNISNTKEVSWLELLEIMILSVTEYAKDGFFK